MDLRLTSLLLLVACASGAWCWTTRNHPRHYRRPVRVQRRSDAALQRPARSISEFLEPPPLPSNYRQSRGPSAAVPPLSYQQRKPKNHNHNQAPTGPGPLSPPSPPWGKQQARNARYVNPQSTNPGYFGKLINLLNPFVDVAANAKDAHSHASANVPQYAPHMPYTAGSNQHGPSYQPPKAPAEQFPWNTAQSCNPCDTFPWTPVIRDDVTSQPGQYAASFGSNDYLAPPAAQFAYSAPTLAAPTNQQSHPTSDPHLSSGPTPPLYQAKPFRDAPSDYSASRFNQLPLTFTEQAPPSSFPHEPAFQNVNQQSAPVHFDSESPPAYQPYQSRPTADQLQSNANAHPLPNGNEHYTISVEQSPIIDIDEAPFAEEDHLSSSLAASSNVDYHTAANVDSDASSNFQVLQQPSADRTKDAPFDLQVEVNNHQDADQAESRPVPIESAAASSTAIPTYYPSPSPSEHAWLGSSGGGGATNVHFQRSPLVEVSVAGESAPSPPTGNRTPTKAKAKAHAESSTAPTATLIDYIVSSPRETSEEETRPVTTTTTSRSTSTSTSTQRSTSVTAADQKQQESRIETLVQAYEFYKSKNRTKLNETSGGKVRYSAENDDFSASREAIAPSKSDNGKKIIQIIIPYTSQYTPSPFHPTKSVKKAKQPDNHRQEETTLHPRLQLYTEDSSDAEDNSLIQESRRVSVTRAPEPALRINRTTGNSIDVHRLQKNIDNWTIQEYSKKASPVRNFVNATYPRWISSKQIPDEYLSSTTTEEDSNEYYDISPHDAQSHRGINRIQVQTTTTTTEATTTNRVNVVNAIYPKTTKKSEHLPKPTSAISKSAEKVYVVTPIPNPNSLEVLSTDKDHEGRFKARRAKVKEDKTGLEQAYQVLPQAVNNLAVLANAPESAAPALWGIMEHEQIASSPNQPRWRSESDALPEPASTPILYAGHSKVTYFRTKVH